MSGKKDSRLRRARRPRKKMRELCITRLSVHRSARHIYAQIIDPDGGKVITQASSLEPELRVNGTGNVETAKKVGTLVAQRAKENGIAKVAFDRSGYMYHGRVKALAEAARAEGLDF